MTGITLPYGTVFQTPHSTKWHHEIAEANTILLSEVGSGLHGVTVGDTDDRDEMGVAIDPPLCMLTEQKFGLYEYRTKPVNVRSGPGDLDLNVYGFRKFTHLAGVGNPTVLMILFSPRSKVSHMEWPGVEMRSQREMFLSRSAGRRFLKYLERQQDRFHGSLAQRTNRPELVEKFGYDTKFAYHAIRLGLQGKQLMDEHMVHLPMIDEHREFLLAVRNGEFTREEVDAKLNSVHDELEASIERSTLPDYADWDVIDKWRVNIYRDWWGMTDTPLRRRDTSTFTMVDK